MLLLHFWILRRLKKTTEFHEQLKLTGFTENVLVHWNEFVNETVREMAAALGSAFALVLALLLAKLG